MREKDITEKALENYNDVFADIVNALVFDGEEVVKGTELEQVLPRGAYKEEGSVSGDHAGAVLWRGTLDWTEKLDRTFGYTGKVEAVRERL